MPFRFRKRIRLLPGVWLNVGKSGVSTSVGGKGITVNLGKRGTRTTVSVPGTGLSYTNTTGSARKPALGAERETTEADAEPIHPEPTGAEGQGRTKILAIAMVIVLIAVLMATVR